jgi:hypothetical protein
MKIIFKNLDNSIGIFTPSQDTVYFDVKAVAEVITPAPYEYPIEWKDEPYNDIYGYDESNEPLMQVLYRQVPVNFETYNTPYWIVEDDLIPEDRTFRNAWEIDESFGEPHGFGGESNQLDEELLTKYKESFK